MATTNDLKNGLITATQVLDMGFGKIVLMDGTVIDSHAPPAPRVQLKRRIRSVSECSSESIPPHLEQGVDDNDLQMLQTQCYSTAW